MRRTAFAAALLAVSASAHAADFTFKVPVNLADFVAPATVKGNKAILCSVSRRAPDQVIGTGSTTLSIPSSGKLNTTVSVDVNVAGPNKPQDASSYRCSFVFSYEVMSFPTFLNPSREIGTGIEDFDVLVKNGQLKPKAGTTPVFIISGNIPK